MNGFQRIKEAGIGLLMVMAAVMLMVNPGDYAYAVVVWILTLGLAITGIRNIVFYFTMAKHMVGGKTMLIQGVILLDFGLITASLTDVPRIYILLYLIGVHAFWGVILVLRALESKKAVEGPWKLKLSHGLVNFLLAIACVVFISRQDTAIIIFGAGLIYSAVMRIITAFRRTAFILIE